MSKAPLLSQLTHLYLRKKHNHFHGCCAAKIFLVVMSKGFNVLFVYNKTILETSSEILSNMVKSSTVLDKSQPFVHTFNVSSKDVGKSPGNFSEFFFVKRAICTFTGIRTLPSLSDLYGRRSR